MNFRFAGLAILASLVATLAGCGGGGGGSGGGNGSGGGGGSSASAPAVTFTGITVNSPPVVSFTVKDSAGKPVTGLKLSDPADTSACGGSNVTFAIAKYDGDNWQNLISRQRFDTSTSGQQAVVEGTTDPTPATTASAGVGTLDEVNGVYTYHFATDVSAPVLMANAVGYASLGRVANNGNLAVKDGHTVHRVALQLCFVDPVTHATEKVNPYMDFTLGADGKGVPFKDLQGNLKPAIQVVDRASCNECHQNFALHNKDLGNDPTRADFGIYTDPQVCVMCHNPGSSDYQTGNAIDFKLMVHKFHMGKRLTKAYTVGTTTAANLLYPQDQRNCVKCHDASENAAHRTSHGSNWIAKPSKNACFACHDDYKDAGSKWQTFHAQYANLAGMTVTQPDLIPDHICQSCHNALGGVAQTSAKEHEVQEWVRGENYEFKIWGVTKTSNNTLTVEYSVRNPKTGTDYDIMDPAYQYTIVNTAGTTTTRTFRFGALNMLFGWNTTDYANDGAIGRAWNSSCTIAPTASPTCDATTGLPKAGTAGALTRGQPPAINVMFDPTVQRVGTSNRFRLTSTALPVDKATGTVAVAFQGRVSEKKDANTSWSIPVKNVVSYFAMSGSVVERRQVVSAAKCNACHGRNLAFTNVTTFKPGLGGHGGSRTDPEVCVICHNGNNPLNGTVVSEGQVTQYAESADFKRMIHMMHIEQGGNYPVWPKELLTTGSAAGKYAGLKRCDVCHVNGSYIQNKSILGTSVTFDVNLSTGAVTDTNAADNLVMSPWGSVCSTCHSTNDVKNHMSIEGGATFGGATQADVMGGKVFEKCYGCHQTGGMAPAIDVAHLGVGQ
jgi:OmcA/MtrC family decaheme c-type cytochrome